MFRGLDPANAASQIVSQDRSDAYAWPGYSNVTRAHAVNNLNQVTQTSSSGLPAPVTFGYDLNGNLTSDGTNGFTYDSENRLTAMSGGSSASLGYDPLGRLTEVTASGSREPKATSRTEDSPRGEGAGSRFPCPTAAKL